METFPSHVVRVTSFFKSHISHVAKWIELHVIERDNPRLPDSGDLASRPFLKA